MNDFLSRSNSVVEYEKVISNLRQNNNTLKVQLEKLMKENQSIHETYQIDLQKLQLQLEHKNLKIKQLEETMEQNGNFEMIFELEKKLEELEIKNNQLESQLYAMTTQQLKNKYMKRRSSTNSVLFKNNAQLSTQNSYENVNTLNVDIKDTEMKQKFDKLDQILDNKKENLVRKFSKFVDPSAQLKVIEDEGSLSNEKSTKNNNTEELVLYVKELENFIEQEKQRNVANDQVFSQLKQKINTLQQKEDNLRQKLNEQEEEKQMLLFEIDNLKTVVEDREQKIQVMQQKQKQELNEIVKKNKIDETNNVINEMSQIHDQLKQEIEIKQSVIEDLRQKLKISEYNLNKKIADKQKTIEEKNNYITDIQDKMKEQIRRLTQKCENLEIEKSQIQEQAQQEIAEELFKSKIQIQNLEKQMLSDRKIENSLIDSESNFHEDLKLEINNDFDIGDNMDDYQPNFSDSEEEVRLRAVTQKVSCQEKQSVRIKNSEPDNFQISILNEELEIAQQRITYLENQVKEKDKQISEQRVKQLEQAKKSDQASKDYYQKLMENLKVDLEHQKIEYETIKEQLEKKVNKLQKEYDYLEENHINQKLTFAEETNKNELSILFLKRKNNQILLQLNAYEEQIQEFNKKVKKSQQLIQKVDEFCLFFPNNIFFCILQQNVSIKNNKIINQIKIY